MRNRLFGEAACAALVTITLLLSALSALAQEPGRRPRRPSAHLGTPPPDDIREVWKIARVVAVFRIETERTVVDEGPFPSEWTIYTARVLRAFKGEEIATQKEHALQIIRMGRKTGDPETDATLDDGYAPFVMGERYVGFLGIWPEPHADCFYPNYLGIGAYQLKDRRVKPHSDAPVAARQRDRKEDDFLEELSDLARTVGEKR